LGAVGSALELIARTEDFRHSDLRGSPLVLDRSGLGQGLVTV
jgi:hypothetical protein